MDDGRGFEADAAPGSGEQADAILRLVLSQWGSAAGILYGGPNGILRRLASIGADDSEDVPDVLDLSQGPLARAITSQEAVVIEPEKEGLDWIRMSTPLGTLRPRAIAIVPIGWNSRVIGIIVAAAGSEETRARFTDLALPSSGLAVVLENAILRDQLARLSTLDELTGTWNRRFGERHLDEQFAVAERHRLPISTVLVTAASAREAPGQARRIGSDAFEAQIGERLVRNLRSGDVAFRLDSQVFAIVSSGTAPSDLELMAERLERVLSGEPVLVRGRRVMPRVNLGVATWPTVPVSNASDLIGRARLALREAQRMGPGRVGIHTETDISVLRFDPDARRAA